MLCPAQQSDIRGPKLQPALLPDPAVARKSIYYLNFARKDKKQLKNHLGNLLIKGLKEINLKTRRNPDG